MGKIKDWTFFQCGYCKRVLPLSDEEKNENGPKICDLCNRGIMRHQEDMKIADKSFDCEFNF